jgi:uncharacterized membrane protein
VAAVSVKRRMGDERGLIGKVVFVWLLLLALFVVAVVDVGSIGLTRFKVANAADKAAFAAAGEYKDTQDRNKAFEAAQRIVEHDVPGAKIVANGFEIDTRTGYVTVKIVDRAWSLVAGRLSYTKPYTKVSATSTSQPPAL